LGIDVTAYGVRAALVRTSYRRVAIEALVEIDIRDPAVAGRDLASAASEVEAIRAAAGGLKPEAIAVGLSGERSFYRRIELPAAAQKELANVLSFELEATVPFEMDDAVFDYLLLKRARGSTSIPIFAAIARAPDVRARVALVHDALGTEPERVGSGGSSLANLGAIYPELDKLAGPILLVNLAEEAVDVLIMASGEGVFARTISRGTMGMPANVHEMVRELRQTVSAFRAAGGDPLAGMVLFGPGSALPNADAYLASELGLPVVPLAPPKLDGLTHDLASRAPRFARALGLALGLARAKSFNLRKGALEAERRYPFLREKVPLLSGLAAVIAVSFGFSVIAEMRSLSTEHDLLEAKLSVASRDVLGEDTTDLDRVRALVEGDNKEEEDPLPHSDGFDAMVQVSKAVPKEVVHDVLSFDYARQHLNLDGSVPAVADAETIAKNLREYKCAHDVKISGTSQLGDSKQKYVLSVDLKCRDPKKKADATAAAAASAAAGASAKPDSGKDAGK
jgi:general secretion pathway protein L